MKIVVATHNKGKVKEISEGISIPGFEFVSISEVMPDYESPVEDAPDFEGNAAIKAMAAHNATGLAALADDSGLIVDALDGAPGVFSARYAGEGASDEQNNAKLLKELENIENRDARFACSLVLVGLDQYLEKAPPYISEFGTCEGKIASKPKGDEGFGYDPLFVPAQTHGKHMAELSQAEKHEISHRGAALNKLNAHIRSII